MLKQVCRALDDQVALLLAQMRRGLGRFQVGSDIGLFEAMFSTRALRRLKPDRVPDELISKVIDAGTQAASGGSEQHWLFVVVKDPAQRKRIADICPQALAIMGSIPDCSD
jgi:hypothetical protein